MQRVKTCNLQVPALGNVQHLLGGLSIGALVILRTSALIQQGITKTEDGIQLPSQTLQLNNDKAL